MEPEEKPKEPWFFKTQTVVLVFLILPPLALPLLWFNPRYRPVTKIIWTIVIVALTIFMWKATESALRSIKSVYEQVF